MALPSDAAWTLKPVHVPGLPPWIDVDPDDGLTIGRADDNDITLAADAHQLVSAHHLRITLSEGQPHVIDLNSTNGTWVNGIRVTDKVVKAGDVISLGQRGPRFVFERRVDLGATALIEAPAVAPVFGDSTVELVRQAVGLEAGHDVQKVVEQRARSHRRVLTAVTVGVLALGAGAVWWVQDLNQREVARLEAINEQLASTLEGTRAELEQQHREWVAQKAALQSEKATLAARLARLEKEDQASHDQLEALRGELEQAERVLALYDPVNLERTRLAGVKSVRDAVVFIETEMRLVDPDSGELVRAERDEHGDWDFVVGGTGEVFSSDKTGSGFVVSDDGWILTNAHVIEASGPFEDAVELADGTEVEPDRVVSVIFNDQDEPHPARIVAELHDDDNDFALLKIEPFEGMPFIAGFAIDRPAPDPGAEVYLFGFPLGRSLVHAGDRVVASTFKGILSRVVAPYFCVDAAVHPGNSGGPVTDASGRVIGIVTAVQRMPEGNITPSIGYVMPIEAVGKIWPPPKGE